MPLPGGRPQLGVHPIGRPPGARALHLSLPNTATCQELFNSATAHGGAAWDHSGMVKALESMAGLAYLCWSRGEYSTSAPLYKQAWEGLRARRGADGRRAERFRRKYHHRS